MSSDLLCGENLIISNMNDFIDKENKSNSVKIQKCNKAIKNIKESITELNVTLNKIIKIKNELKKK